MIGSLIKGIIMKNFPSHLLNGYAKFISGAYISERELYHELAEQGQVPQTMLIACCDSRAAPETIFNAKPGELFVVRNVANLVPPFAPNDDGQHGTSAALEFGVQVLKIKNIVIMGHAQCGGIHTALNPLSEPLAKGDFIGKWLNMLSPLAQQINANQHIQANSRQLELERQSVVNSLDNLRSFPYIGEKETKGELSLYGAWFDIKTGELWVLNSDGKQFEKI